MRSNRRLALGAALLSFALLAAACGNDDNGSGGGETGSTGGGPSIASQLTLGGPPECPQRPFCVIGLKDTYGVTFGDFKPLDVGGPLTVKALESGAVDVGLLFSTDPTIADKGFVVLEDDKHLQQAENITPLVRKDVDSPELDDALNGVSAVLTTDNIVPLIKQVNDGADPKDVAQTFLQDNGLMEGAAASGMPHVTVGVSGAFAENQIVAEMYALVLEHAGYQVDTQLDLASREVSDKALESGEIDVKPEYLGSELVFLDPNAQTSGDPQQEVDALQPLLEAKGFVLLEPSEANDTNVFVVTQETADQYGLQSVSDLAKPAS